MTDMKFEEIYPKLLKLQLFQYFEEGNEEDKRLLEAAYKSITVKQFKAKDVIIKEGEIGDTLFILVSGKVSITRSTLSGDQIALAHLDDSMGVFFGENSLVENAQRSATITADTDCRTLVLTSSQFTEISEKEPAFGYKVLLSLAQQMSNTIKKSNTDVSTLYEALYNEIADE